MCKNSFLSTIKIKLRDKRKNKNQINFFMSSKIESPTSTLQTLKVRNNILNNISALKNLKIRKKK